MSIMPKNKLISQSIILMILLIFFFILKTIYDSGTFKTIRPHYEGNCNSVYNIVGPEDITILDNGIAFISSDNRRKTLEGNPEQGNIYYYNLNEKNPRPICLTIDMNFEFHPHGISLYKKDSNEIRLMAINHRTHENTIEVFDFKEGELIFIKTIRSDLLNSPNDLVLINENEFYLTNDHGWISNSAKMIEDYLQLSRANVIYYDGKQFKTLISELNYANGINISKDKVYIYIAETIAKKISIYKCNSLNELIYVKSIYLNTGVDNIELDEDGNLWVAAHPQMLSFVEHAKNINKKSASQVIKISNNEYGEYISEEMYLDDGNIISGSSTAAVYKNIMLIGSVFEDYFLHCKFEN